MFGDVTQHVAELLEGRVLVAHNAPFDYGSSSFSAVSPTTVAAAIDGAVAFGDLGPIELVAGPGTAEQARYSKAAGRRAAGCGFGLPVPARPRTG